MAVSLDIKSETAVAAAPISTSSVQSADIQMTTGSISAPYATQQLQKQTQMSSIWTAIR